MRRALFLTFGILELIAAGLLFELGNQLPRSAEVEQSFEQAGRVTDRAATQVYLFRHQVEGLQQMQLAELSRRLQKQTLAITTSLRDQSVDFETVRTMRDALGDVSGGLKNLAETLDPEALGKLSTGLGDTASFLDEKVIPAAKQAADNLDASTEALQKDARQLCVFLKETPPDLKAVREVYNSLARFREGLDRMDKALKLGRLDTMREGFHGLESSLNIGAEQVERLSGYTYPSVTFNGLRPEIRQRPFWPEGEKIADGMRKAAEGATAAGKELESMAADLPQIRASLGESRAMVDRVREALGATLQHQDKIEPLLRDAPLHAARLAEQLPKVGGGLAQILRDTQRLKDVAVGLRQAQKAIDATVSHWPDLRLTLSRLAVVLRATRDQLDRAVKHRREYEAGVGQTVQLAETFAALLPLVSEQFDGRLHDQQQTLTELGQSLDDVGGALPAYAATTSRLLRTGRLLAWLVAAIVALHGCYLVLTARIGRRYSL
jgi:ABC-type transporter Mla subunit MlaD